MRLPDPHTSRAVLIGTRNYDADFGLAELPGVTGNVNGLMRALVGCTGLRPAHCLALVDLPTSPRERTRRIELTAQPARPVGQWPGPSPRTPGRARVTLLPTPGSAEPADGWRRSAGCWRSGAPPLST